MVSTRGVKFKFTEGERVLCYEPDPTKAKVLYESKVLELVVTRDNRGRKTPEYLVHFQGWNSSWDRCVGEDFVLQDTPDSRNLQRKLAYDAALNLKGKKRKKLPAIFKDPYIKKRCFEGSKDNNDTDDSEDGSETSEENDDDIDDEDEDSEDEEDVKENQEDKNPFADLQLSNFLKEKLEDDCFFISVGNKLVKLPCEPNVISILEGYVKQLSFSLLCTTPSIKGSRQAQGTHRAVPADIEQKINLNKELVDGIRVFFDFALPLSLLYKEEKQQYENIDSLVVPEISSPVSTMSSLLPSPKEYIKELEESFNESKISKDLSRQESLPWHSFHPLSRLQADLPLSAIWNKTNSISFPHPASPPPLAAAMTPKNGSRQRHPSTRNSCNSPLGLTSVESTPALAGSSSQCSSGISNVATIRTRTWARSQSLLKGNQSPTSSSEDTSTRRVTRSSTDKTRLVLSESFPKSDLLSPAKAPLENQLTDAVSAVDQCVTSNSSSPPSTPLKPHGNHNNNTSQGSKPWLLTPCKTTITHSQRGSPPPALNLTSISSVSSSASSTHSDSTMLTRRTLDSKHKTSHLRDPSGLLNEILSWQMLPPSVFKEKPALPSMVYGAQHLLRLFVKLPDYLERMNIQKHKQVPLVEGLKNFLKYLEDKCRELYPTFDYRDAKDFENNYTSIKKENAT